MRRLYIMNASPLIVLGRADLLATISPLADQWIIPYVKSAKPHNETGSVLITG